MSTAAPTFWHNGLTELHRHLDVSVRTETLYRLALKQNLITNQTTFETFKKKVYLKQPLSDLRAVLAKFEIFPKVQSSHEVLELVAFEALEDVYQQGIRRIELRFAPDFISAYQKHLSWDAILKAYESGMKRALGKFSDLNAGFICIASRDFGPESAARTVEFFLKHKDRFIGLDLAGNEDQFPCRLFETAFAPARKQGAQITIHAGEGSGPDNVWEAIEFLGAKRIGHGIQSIRDPKLVSYLRDHQIPLEICPTSNWITQAVPSLDVHPIKLLLRAGVPVTLNTDDPGIFDVTLPGEYALCETLIGLTSEELVACEKTAKKVSFLKLKV